ncbi:ABC transporter transmembrane domain-containing protein [Yeosuana sp. AK3]
MKTKWQLIFELIKNNKLLVSIAFVSGLFYNIFTILIPISIGKFYEFNFGLSSKRLNLLEFFPAMHTENFIGFLYVFIALILLRYAFEHTNKYTIGIVGEKFAKDLREQLFKHQLQIKFNVYDNEGIGKYLLRYSGDLKSIQNYVTQGLLRFSQDLILILILIGVIGLINYRLSIIVGVFIVFSVLILSFINIKLYSISVNQRNRRSGMLSFVNTRLRAIASIKVFNKYTPEEKSYQKRSEKLYAIGKKNQFVVSLVESIIPLLTYTMLATLMWYIYNLKHSEGSSFNEASLLILILLIISFLPILRRTLRVNVVWKIGSISFQKLIRILHLEDENNLAFESLNLSKAVISFNKVAFKHENSKNYVFKNLNFTLHPKQNMLFIGASGSGKNTLIKLFLKIYNSTHGTINFGGYEFSSLSEKTIRKNISVISNTFPLYGKTVYEAIVYSIKKEKELMARVLLEDIQKFESDENKLKLEDKIGDLGSKLTNGQKRILMYCRLFLTNKPWFIIDQPFLDLNTKTQFLIQEKLNALKGKKTVIFFDNKMIKGLKIDQTYCIEDKEVKPV